MDKYLHDILTVYGFTPPFKIKQIDKKSVWQINDKYILKKNDEEEKDIEKILAINKLLNAEGVNNSK